MIAIVLVFWLASASLDAMGNAPAPHYVTDSANWGAR